MVGKLWRNCGLIMEMRTKDWFPPTDQLPGCNLRSSGSICYSLITQYQLPKIHPFRADFCVQSTR
jgi:hypothetical protein